MKQNEIGKLVTLGSATVLGALLMLAGPQNHGVLVHADDQAPASQTLEKTADAVFSRISDESATNNTQTDATTVKSDGDQATTQVQTPVKSATPSTAADAESDASQPTGTTDPADSKDDTTQPVTATTETSATTVDDVWHDGVTDAWQERWLTEEGSRMVENPTEGGVGGQDVTQSDDTARATMPLNAAYLGSEDYDNESDIITLSDGHSPYQPGENVYQFKLDAATWTKQARRGPSFTDDGQMVLQSDGSYSVEQAKTTGLSLKPGTRLAVTISQISPNATFELKINAGKEFKIVTGINRPGTYYFDLSAYGDDLWSAKDITWLPAIVSGDDTATLTISDIHLDYNAGFDAKKSQAETYTNSWRPDRLDYTADYESGMKVSGTDFFKDKNTIVRTVNVNDQGNLFVNGKIFGSDPQLIGNTLVFKAKTNWAGISFSQTPVKLTFYANLQDLENEQNALAAPIEGGYYAADFSNLKNSTLYIAYTTAALALDDASFSAQAQAAAQGDMVAAQQAATDRVNAFYAKIPQPTAQQLNILDKGTTAESQLQTYYKAWTIMHESNMDPELGYDYAYPTYATSKAYIWHNGSEVTRYAASWEAFYTMQYESFIDPDTAWQNFIGQISQVSDDGSLAGEGLPVNRARVALILYNNSTSTEQGLNGLKQTWQKIEQNLKWALENPYWVFPGSTGSDQPDTDFLASAIIDIPYMEQLYDLLQANGVITDAAARKATLEQMKAEQIKNYEDYFFFGPDGKPIQKVLKKDGKLSDPNPDIVNELMVTKALHMPGLTDDEYAKVLSYFNSLFDSDQDFGHMGVDKYEEWAYTVYGLLEHGQKDLAMQLIDTTLRDAPRAHTLGEELRGGEDGKDPYIAGVHVSAFGSAQMIDAFWMANGLRYDAGGLRVYNLTADGAVSGIRSGNDVYSYTLKDGVVTDYKNGKLFKVETIGPDDDDFVDLRTAPVVDPTALKAAIAEANQIDAAKYSADSVKSLDQAVSQGQTVLADTSSTQAGLDDATAAIQQALKDLDLIQKKTQVGPALSVDPADFYDHTKKAVTAGPESVVVAKPLSHTETPQTKAAKAKTTLPKTGEASSVEVGILGGLVSVLALLGLASPLRKQD